VGKMANLKDKGFDQAQTKPKTGGPSNPLALGAALSGASSSSSRSVPSSSTSAAGPPGAGPPVFKKPRIPK